MAEVLLVRSVTYPTLPYPTVPYRTLSYPRSARPLSSPELPPRPDRLLVCSHAPCNGSYLVAHPVAWQPSTPFPAFGPPCPASFLDIQGADPLSCVQGVRGSPVFGVSAALAVLRCLKRLVFVAFLRGAACHHVCPGRDDGHSENCSLAV